MSHYHTREWDARKCIGLEGKMEMRRNRLNAIISGLVLLAMLIAAPGQVFARGEEDEKDGGVRIGYSNETGRVSFIGADPSQAYRLQGVAIESFAPQERPMLYLDHFKEMLGLQQPSRELVKTVDRQHDGRSTTRYQQKYEGIPILGGELIVNLDRRGALLSISGEVSPDLSLATTPEITAD